VTGAVHRCARPLLADVFKIVKRFRGGLIFKAQRLLDHSTLGSREIKKKKKKKHRRAPPLVADVSRFGVERLRVRVEVRGLRVEGGGLKVEG